MPWRIFQSLELQQDKVSSGKSKVVVVVVRVERKKKKERARRFRGFSDKEDSLTVLLSEEGTTF